MCTVPIGLESNICKNSGPKHDDLSDELDCGCFRCDVDDRGDWVSVSESSVLTEDSRRVIGAMRGGERGIRKSIGGGIDEISFGHRIFKQVDGDGVVITAINSLLRQQYQYRISEEINGYPLSIKRRL